MRNEIKVSITHKEGNQIQDRTISCPVGTSLESLVPQFGDLQSPLAAVKANNEILPLSSRLEVNARLEPVFLESPEGVSIYRYSLAFLLAVAARELLPERSLYIGHSLGHSYYYTFLEGKKPEKEEI